VTEPTGPDMADGPPQENPAPDLVGTVLAGRYRLLKLLGEGAMGAVYLGEHTRIGRHDAIKVLRKGLTSDAESIARFNRGARNLSAIRHANVCTLYDYGETADGSPFLALELIDGESLKDLVTRERALDPRRAISIAIQTANALDAAHHAGIVHRDLKPANIMLERGRDGSDVVKVVDFDIAKGPEPEGGEEVTRLGFVVGTPEYMSPEQLTGEKLDGRSDIYSLGITLFRMLTGLMPFRATDTQNIMIERLTEAPLSLIDVRADLAFPVELQRVLDRALARDRAERYSQVAEVARDLEAVLRSYDPAAAAPPQQRASDVPETRVAPSGGRPVPAPAPTSVPRRIPAWLMAAAVVVIAGGPLAVLLTRSPSTDGPAARGEDQQLSLGGGTADSGNAPVDTAGAGGRNDAPRGGGGGDNTGAGGGNQPEPQRPEPQPQPPEPQPVSARLTAAEAVNVLFELQERMTDGSPLGVTTDARIVAAAADTAEQLWAAPGMVRSDSALAAFIRGMAALGQRDRAGCESWLDRAIALGNRAAGSLRENCSSVGG